MAQSEIKKDRWVLHGVQNLTYGHVKFVARTFNVPIAEVIDFAVECMVNQLAKNQTRPEAWHSQYDV